VVGRAIGCRAVGAPAGAIHIESIGTMRDGGQGALKGALACVLACIWCNPVTAEGKAVRTFLNGNRLVEHCSAAGYGYEYGLCEGYVMAIADAISGGDTVLGYTACIPLPVDGNQVREIVVAALHRDVAVRHAAARGLVAKAIAEAFPCSAN
jgi:Rap1a immunity proteins